MILSEKFKFDRFFSIFKIFRYFIDFLIFLIKKYIYKAVYPFKLNLNAMFSKAYTELLVIFTKSEGAFVSN